MILFFIILILDSCLPIACTKHKTKNEKLEREIKVENTWGGDPPQPPQYLGTGSNPGDVFLTQFFV